MASPEAASRVRVVGRYALHHEIASGGMASIFLGKMSGPVGFAPIVAVKSLHPQFAKDPEFVSMFLDEARLAGRIRHPNIVPVIDVHAEADELFLVLEYVHGESLGRLLSAGRRYGHALSQSLASAILCDVLQGLHAAHEAKDERGEPLGIVHRDVSPQNVLVGADGIARVLDFGVAKATGRVTSTRDGQVKGKFAYMAPEQLRGELVDRRADVYSAAVVLWEALTGERLFRGENEGHTVERVLFGALSPPSSYRPEIPPALDAVVMRALSRERADRFGTAKEMAMALSAAVPPASATEVGEWVEAQALDALERRSKLIAAVEASARENEPLPATEVKDPEPVTPGRRGRRVIAMGVLALGASLLLLGFGLRAYGTPHPAATLVVDPPAGSASGGEPAPTAATPSPPSSAQTSNAPASEGPAPSVVAATASSSPRARSVAGSAPAHGPTRGPKPGAAASKAACQRRGADGEIEFDMECLRATQHAP